MHASALIKKGQRIVFRQLIEMTHKIFAYYERYRLPILADEVFKIYCYCLGLFIVHCCPKPQHAILHQELVLAIQIQARYGQALHASQAKARAQVLALCKEGEGFGERFLAFVEVLDERSKKHLRTVRNPCYPEGQEEVRLSALVDGFLRKQLDSSGHQAEAALAALGVSQLLMFFLDTFTLITAWLGGYYAGYAKMPLQQFMALGFKQLVVVVEREEVVSAEMRH